MIRLLLLSILTTLSFGADKHFKLFKKGENDSNRTLLVIGGIHGDEPGGYFSAALLVKHYKIRKGSLWVVPNLNFDSILRFRRGVYGDMNRKFADIKESDPDFKIVEDIKKVIIDPHVSLVLNLHDGRGYYRHKWQNSIFNPYVWGQACIIDQERIGSGELEDLNKLANRVNASLNGKNLQEPYHKFHIKNTKTKDKDEQMRLSLTYFAIKNRKPALAIETSKNITDLSLKIYYQLNAIEEFMKLLEIEYERDFSLKRESIERLLQSSGSEVVFDKIYTLPIENLRSYINYFPLCSQNPLVESDDPLVGIRKNHDGYILLQRGHILKSRLKPEYFTECKPLRKVEISIDGKTQNVKIGSIIDAKEYFEIIGQKGVRTNVIGWSRPGTKEESGFKIYKKDILPRFSVDKNGSLFRVEFYRNRAFAGALLVRFQKR